MNWVICQGCGNVFDTEGTKTTAHSGCCPKCGLHYQGHYRVVKPILNPSPMAAKPIPERTCKFVSSRGTDYPPVCSECGYELGIYDCEWLDGGAYHYGGNYCPNCGRKVVE